MNRFTCCENGVIADGAFCNRLQKADTASILLLSDTHGAVDAVQWILSNFSEECQACLFAGDGAQDIITVVREATTGLITVPPVIIMAQGNCDSQLYPPIFPDSENPKPFGLPVYQQKTIAGQHILLAHGHLHHVELDGRKLSMTAYGGFAILSIDNTKKRLTRTAAESDAGIADTDGAVIGKRGELKLYALTKKNTGAFSAAVHAVYPIYGHL